MTDNGTTSPSTESGVALQHGGATYTVIMDGMLLFFAVQTNLRDMEIQSTCQIFKIASNKKNYALTYSDQSC